MTHQDIAGCTAFDGARLIATGALAEVARAAKTVIDSDPHAAVLIFDDETARQVEVDFRGTAEDVAARLSSPGETPPVPRGPGRPKLGVVAREITLLPRHWDWLAAQPGGASVALRKLVDEARRSREPEERRRAAQEAAYRFMGVMAGDRPGFEEATRALFAGDRERFRSLVEAWPKDVRAHAERLAAPAWNRPDV
jgi:hypothetical protein